MKKQRNLFIILLALIMVGSVFLLNTVSFISFVSTEPPLPTLAVLPDSTIANSASESAQTGDVELAILPSQLPVPTIIELEQEAAPEQVVIQFQPDTTEAQQQAYIESIDGEVQQELTAINTMVVEVMETDNLPTAEFVLSNEPDYYVTALFNVPPSDPFYAEQWGLHMVEAPAAWATLPDPTPQITIAVVDSGACFEHPDLAGQYLSNGYDFVENDNTPQDEYGHGCGVSGILAANADDAVGIAGVAPNAQIMPLRVLDENGIGTYSDVAAAIIYATDNGAEVINLSVGGANASRVLEDAVKYATANGVTLVGAAGNSAGTLPLFPARYNEVISVGAINSDGTDSGFSNRGADVKAPGSNIYTTHMNGTHHTISGTSFAAPFVSGLVGLSIASDTPLNLNSGELLVYSDQLVPTPEATEVVEAPINGNIEALAFCDTVVDIPTEECEALEALYNSTNGAGWTTNTGWLSDTTVNNWHGVTVTAGNVTQINLQNNQLTGTIPVELGDLSELEILWLNINQLTGSIPSELGNLSDLEVLYLYSNQLTNSIPSQLGDLSKLIDLRISANQLTGSIPIQLGQLSQLQVLWLAGNQLNGSIPAELGNLTNLRELALAFNQLTGSIPTEIGNLTNLVELNLSQNQLNGPIPEQLGHNNLVNLEILDLSDNRLGENELVEAIPGSIWQLPKLRVLDVSENALDSRFPSYFKNLATLDNLTLAPIEELYLNGNTYTGEIHPDFVYMNTLTTLDLGYNAMYASGAVDTFVTNLDADWKSTQTTKPANFEVTTITDNSITLQWAPITYTGNGGYYEISYGTNFRNGTFPNTVNTPNKTSTSITINGLSSDTTYYFRIRAYTPPHVGNPNDMYSATNRWDEEFEPIIYGRTTGTFTCANVTDVPVSDCEALVDFYNGLDGNSWDDNTNWLTGTTVAPWYGVGVGSGRVNQISLIDNNLYGELPASITDLTGLRWLFLERNLIYGSLPSNLGDLTEMTVLRLYSNNFSGPIPASIENMTGVAILDLYRNEFSGSLPSTMGNWNVGTINLFENNLSGNIPSSIGNLSSSRIDLRDNELEGSIPTTIGNLSNIQILDLSQNNLSGNIPTTIGNLTTLRELYLDFNQLEGAIPTQLGDIGASLTKLDLFSNYLIGEVPSSITNLTNLSTLELRKNGLYASGATEIFLTSISSFWDEQQLLAPTDFQIESFDSNSVSFSWEIPPKAFGSSSGYFYGVSYDTVIGGSYDNFVLTPNRLTPGGARGTLTIPGLTHNTTYYFRIRGYEDGANDYEFWSEENPNTLQVTLPFDCTNITDIPNIECEALVKLYQETNGDSWNNNTNWMQGSTADDWHGIIIQNGHVTHISLNLNNLSGTIPEELGNLSELTNLQMYTNNLTGTIPTELGQLTKLQNLILYSNNLSGTIPSEIGQLTALQSLQLDRNNLNGSLPDLSQLTSLTDLQLFGNQFNGAIPTWIGQLTSLNYVYLYDNQFSGELPSELGALTGLVNLRLAGNNLTGEIPANLTALTSLTNLDIGYNALFASGATETFITSKDPDWLSTQTGVPTNPAYVSSTNNSVTISWIPISYTANGGGYEISYDTNINGTYANAVTTSSKTDTNFEITGLQAGTTYYFRIRAKTGTHANNQNEVFGGYSEIVSGRTTGGFDCATVIDVPQIECEALVEFYHSTNGKHWTNNTNWLTSTQVGTWNRVTVQGGHVTRIFMGENALYGTLPPELGNLSGLQELNLVNHSNLTGGIPSTLGNLGSLTKLRLSNIPLGGTVPSTLGNLTNLQELDLINLELTGTLPASLGNLDELFQFSISHNEINGSIPAEFGNMSTNAPYLEFYLRNNNLTGNIPPEFANIPKLARLDLSQNELTGTIPAVLGSIDSSPYTFHMDLSDNKLEGEIPAELADLDLSHLYLQKNQLRGVVPQAILDLFGTITVDLNYNVLNDGANSLPQWEQTQARPPRNISGSGITQFVAELNWDHAPTILPNGGYYEISYDTDINGAYANVFNTASRSDRTYTLSSLSPGTTYYVRFRAYVESHENNQSALWSDYETFSFTTLPALVAPVGWNTVETNRSNATISWTITQPDQVDMTYVLRLDGGNWVTASRQSGELDSYRDDTLRCGQSYSYRVYTYRDLDASYSPESSTHVVNTDACPTPVTNTVGLYKDGFWEFVAANGDASAAINFLFGPQESGWIAITGDWDGDGNDGIGIYKDGIFMIRIANSSGLTDRTFEFGPQESGWLPVVGDWNGDDIDSVGVYKDGTFYLSDSNDNSSANYRFIYGPEESGYLPIGGDWNGSGSDTIGLYKDGRFHLSNRLRSGVLTRGFTFGPTEDWLPLVGDWDEDGVTTVGVFSTGIWRLRNTNSAGSVDFGFNFGSQTESDWQPIATYRGGVQGLQVIAAGIQSSEPEATSEIAPEATEAIEPTPEPEVTDVVETTPEPEVIDEVEVTVEPEVTDVVEQTPTPEIIVEPEVTLEPEVEETVTPEVVPTESTPEPVEAEVTPMPTEEVVETSEPDPVVSETPEQVEQVTEAPTEEPTEETIEEEAPAEEPAAESETE